MTVRPQLAHLGIYTNRLAVMERYYTDVIGLVVSDRGPVLSLDGREVVFFSANAGAHHQFVLADAAFELGTSCINQISFKLDTLDELRVVNQRVVDAAVAPIRPVDHGNAWSIYSADPDGNGIEIYVDSPWQVAQPHARPLDLSSTDDEILAVTEAAVRADPTFRERDEWSRVMRTKLAAPIGEAARR
jgi:catechol 2,3-dioxygenase